MDNIFSVFVPLFCFYLCFFVCSFSSFFHVFLFKFLIGVRTSLSKYVCSVAPDVIKTFSSVICRSTRCTIGANLRQILLETNLNPCIT